ELTTFPPRRSSDLCGGADHVRRARPRHQQDEPGRHGGGGAAHHPVGDRRPRRPAPAAALTPPPVSCPHARPVRRIRRSEGETIGDAAALYPVRLSTNPKMEPCCRC